jgi:hypothetical protein
VILDYLCERLSGEARAGSDALEVAWSAPEELERFLLHEKALEVIREGFSRAVG